MYLCTIILKYKKYEWEVYYKRKCKGGNVGDFNYGKIIFDETEESIKINKITYDLYSENETEE